MTARCRLSRIECEGPEIRLLRKARVAGGEGRAVIVGLQERVAGEDVKRGTRGRDRANAGVAVAEERCKLRATTIDAPQRTAAGTRLSDRSGEVDGVSLASDVQVAGRVAHQTRDAIDITAANLAHRAEFDGRRSFPGEEQKEHQGPAKHGTIVAPCTRLHL
jgi:hypothetical protein